MGNTTLSSISNTMNIAAKVLLGFGILMTVISFFKNDWLIPIVSALTGLIILTDFKLRQKKEINRFTSKFLEFDKMKYHEKYN